MAQRDQLAAAQTGVGGNADELAVLTILGSLSSQLLRADGECGRSRWSPAASAGERFDLLGRLEVEAGSLRLCATVRCARGVVGERDRPPLLPRFAITS